MRSSRYDGPTWQYGRDIGGSQRNMPRAPSPPRYGRAYPPRLPSPSRYDRVYPPPSGVNRGPSIRSASPHRRQASHRRRPQTPTPHPVVPKAGPWDAMEVVYTTMDYQYNFKPEDEERWTKSPSSMPLAFNGEIMHLIIAFQFTDGALG